MDACPKCNFAITPDAAECPACGVILAKLRSPASLPRPAETVPPPFPTAAPNPYAPPVASVEGLPAPLPVPQPAAPTPDVITPMTLSVLTDARPWIRFLVGYGFVTMTLVLLGALGLVAFGLSKPAMLPVALIYLVYAGVGFSIVMPLHRSTKALAQLGIYESSAVLETFAIEQAVFWRRTGLICAVSVVLIAIAVLFGGLAGVLASMSQ